MPRTRRSQKVTLRPSEQTARRGAGEGHETPEPRPTRALHRTVRVDGHLASLIGARVDAPHRRYKRDAESAKLALRVNADVQGVIRR